MTLQTCTFNGRVNKDPSLRGRIALSLIIIFYMHASRKSLGLIYERQRPPKHKDHPPPVINKDNRMALIIFVFPPRNDSYSPPPMNIYKTFSSLIKISRRFLNSRQAFKIVASRAEVRLRGSVYTLVMRICHDITICIPSVVSLTSLPVALKRALCFIDKMIYFYIDPTICKSAFNIPSSGH